MTAQELYSTLVFKFYLKFDRLSIISNICRIYYDFIITFNRDADSSEMEYSEEKFDPEKEDEMTDSLEEGQGHLVMNLDDKPPLLDYTDMDAVD